jgi:hypothetical protein
MKFLLTIIKKVIDYCFDYLVELKNNLFISSNAEITEMYTETIGYLHTCVKSILWLVSISLTIEFSGKFFTLLSIDRTWWLNVLMVFGLWSLLYRLYAFIIGHSLINISINQNLKDIKKILDK